MSYIEVGNELEKDFLRESKSSLAHNELIVKSRIEHYQHEIETMSENYFISLIGKESTNKIDNKNANVYMLSMANAHKDLMQVRYISNEGDELIRVNRNLLGQNPYIVSSKELQNKKERYYFKTLSSMPENSVWFSEIDLNEEHGKVEVPYAPTLRIGRPVFIRGERKGMIVINIFIDVLLKNLQRSETYSLYLTDDTGEFIIHPQDEYSWSKYLKNGYSLDNEFPLISTTILTSDSYANENIFSKSLEFGQSQKYYLIAKLNPKTLEARKVELIKKFLLISLIVFIILFPFGLILVRNFEHLSARLSAVIDSLGDGIFILNKDAKASYINNEGTHILEYSASEILGQNMHQLLSHGDEHGVYIAQEHCPIQNVNKPRQQFRSDENSFTTKSGKVINVEFTTTPFFVNDNYEGSITVFHDITHRKRMEKELTEFSRIIEQIDDIVAITNLAGDLTYVNKAFCKFTGYSEEEALGENPRLYSSGKHSQAEMKELWATILSGKVYRGIIINQKKNGEDYYEEKMITPLLDEFGEISSFVSTGKDITQRVEMELKMEALASTDFLTGLYNRFKFEEFYTIETKRSARYNEPLSLIMFDIDYFKKINDVFGHDIGDSVLKELSALVRSGLRESDILARWGGEEFMLLTPAINLESAFRLAEKLRHAIEGFNFTEVRNVTCSLGVIEIQKNEESDSAYKRVDTALYAAKESGRNRTVKGKA